ncbi:ferritin family protein [Natronospora cellulosivora (SeqCode)]
MTDEKLLLYLNWFYTLELSQVDFYLTQAERSEDEYISHVLLHLVETEIDHAKKIKSYIHRLDSSPTKIGSNLSKISSYFADFTTYFGTVNMFFLNYHLETLAYKDYLSFFRKLDSNKTLEKELADVLLSNLIDEDIHRNWFISKREALNKIKAK